MRLDLTPEQKEARRKERNARTFSDAAYRHYDTSEGFGSAEEWFRKASETLGENLRTCAPRPQTQNQGS